MSIRVRFAPSPTGYLHIGGARTALFNWLLARKHQGTFVLRIEDTDRQRSTPEAVQAILDGMAWLGIDWDEGPFYQTERLELYRAAAEQLRSQDRAYECTCTPEELEQMRERARALGRKPKYDGTCRSGPRHPGRPAVLRLRAPHDGVTVVRDLIKGHVSFDNHELDDLVLVRTDGHPTYNFSVVVDDHHMGMTHVLRGDDHLSNTPRQVHMYEALGWELPKFGHLPMILGADKQRLSKRHGATSVTEYRDQGYLPWALVNYLVRLGWSAGDQEIFSPEELVAAFSVEGIGRSAAVFNPDKLLWLNAHYLKEMEPGDLGAALAPFFEKEMGRDVSADPRLPAVAELFQKRAKTLAEMAPQARFFFLDAAQIEYEDKARAKFLTPAHRPTLEKLVSRIEALPTFAREGLEEILSGIVEEDGLKLVQVAQPARVALTGGTVSPGIFEVMEVLGRDETLVRLRRALAAIPVQ